MLIYYYLRHFPLQSYVFKYILHPYQKVFYCFLFISTSYLFFCLTHFPAAKQIFHFCFCKRNRRERKAEISERSSKHH
ncbi:hypothetical protein BJV82DRAFT_606558 [Fennellomyces sp. T-0311]|nr:hypothetical protein BJV82DRAFT_606558 [Fennellomyces sp. T-0311]